MSQQVHKYQSLRHQDKTIYVTVGNCMKIIRVFHICQRVTFSSMENTIVTMESNLLKGLRLNY